MSPSLTDYRVIAYGGPLRGRSFSDLIRERFSGVVPTAEPAGFPFVSNLKLWLRADDLDLADGDKVAVWRDQSGNAFDATQATEANKPIFKEDILNGRPVLRFDGVNDYFSLTGAALGITQNVSSITAIVVCKASNFATDRYIMFFSTGTAAGSNRFGIVKAGTTNTRNFHTRRLDADIAQSITSGAVDEAFHIWSALVDYSVPQMVLALDGTTGTPLTPSYGAGLSSNTASLTGNIGLSSGTGFFSGDIAEVLVYNRALTDNERKAVERYLGTKYGIAVA